MSSSQWSNGYNTDLLYTYGYYRELSPLYLKYLLTTQGYGSPDVSSSDFTACELGFGQGISITMHAASTNNRWFGTDFNPTQVNFARSLAQQSSTKVELFDDSFEQFADRDDLPKFDFICLHGIWSWISPENRDFIKKFIAKNLKVGGIVYISYNTSPGFITFEPVRHIMNEYNKLYAAQAADPTRKLNRIGEMLNELCSIDPDYIKVVPRTESVIKDTLTKDFHYLFGEYCNEYWLPCHFSDLAKELNDNAKATFACSATISELMDETNLTAAQQTFLERFRGSNMYETFRDFIVNQQFRRDLFIKGPIRLTAEEQEERLNETCFVMTRPMCDVEKTFKTRLGTATLLDEIYDPILNLMSDYNIRSVKEIRQAVEGKIAWSAIQNAIMTLVRTATLSPAVRQSSVTKEMKQRSIAINKQILAGFPGAQLNCLCSPAISGGVYVSELSQRLLSVYLDNPSISEKDLCENLLRYLESTGQNLKKSGEDITDPKDQEEALTRHIHNFLHNYIPMYKSLMLI